MRWELVVGLGVGLAFAVGAWVGTPTPSLTASPARVHAKGTIQVKTYVPATYDEPAGGPKLVRISVVETFRGDIAGEGRVEFLQMVRGDGSASFVGLERVAGAVGGKSGTFVLQDAGRSPARRSAGRGSSCRAPEPDS